ncbi:lipoyl(octanoyl) transferase [Kwoniella heveanensis CBS 569]|uniref:lipoyl(octanoyl) transferase n=1 Tax=Kwoniella heveanensis BCC8398 TaxID=1296120 RepID=A0A1B9GNN1_9TREE|nr:lipoyl(octanoyl) transferase [Kwoniella heveanensis BCC8398]OCF40112.1 lipoyl(octanoyl) transferase [Kwoniella heveanensis CBS 569]
MSARPLSRLFSNCARRQAAFSLGPASISIPSTQASSSSSSSASASSASTSSSTPCYDPSLTAALPPLRYHIFREPLPYPLGLKLQNDIIDVRLEAKKRDPVGSRGKGDVVLLLEHTPTYTTGRRDNSPNPDELHPEEKKVQNVGASFYITKRGGQVTYHGPGQLVGYPILDLNVMETPTRCYVEYLQAMLAEYAREDLGLQNVLAPHPDGHVGVFASPTEKFASIGIHLRHRITSHGFAMNITPQPIPWFDLVLACGLADVRAISLHDLLARAQSHSHSQKSVEVIPPVPLTVRDTAEALIPKFGEMFNREILPLEESTEMETKSNLSGSGREGEEEVAAIRRLVERAEEEARVENEKNGGWPDRPDLSKRG